MAIITVITQDDRTQLHADRGDNLYQVLIRGGVAIDAPCGGHGVCAKCKVRVLNGDFGAYTDVERKKLGGEMEQGIRLACMCQVHGNATVKPVATKHGKAQIMTQGAQDAQCTDNEEGYGLAVDIGTTTVAAFLMDLQTGKIVATASALNDQRPYGADVIARCSYCMDNEDGLSTLGTLIRKQIAGLVKELAAQAGINRQTIRRACLAGNPTMMHLLALLPVNSIAVAPYHPVYTDGFDVMGVQADIGIAEDGIVRYMPVVSGYVGADTVAAVMAADLDNAKELTLLVDIGTNGEIVLGDQNRMLTCSAAAGPAFEGGKITCGIGGVEGAIDKVGIKDALLTYTTIQDKRARGICGSGLIDCIAMMSACCAIDEAGVLSTKYCTNTSVKSRMNENGLYLAKESEGAQKDVFVNQHDIREVQLAKSAICAGIDILILRMGVQRKDIKKVFLAGGFGTYINYDSACAIGLLPSELRPLIQGIGNAAGTGARMAVCSQAQRDRAQVVGRKLEYIELAQAKEFSDLFMDNMMFDVDF